MFEDIENLSIKELINKLIEVGSDYTRNSRICTELSDQDLLSHCVERVLGDFQSGRDYLQHCDEVNNIKIARATFFKALKSKRRLGSIKDICAAVNKKISTYFSSINVNYLSDFPQLNDFDIYAGDGHYIQHACHTASYDSKLNQQKRRSGELPKLHAAGVIYMQSLRDGLLYAYAPVTDGGRKTNEMPVFRNHFSEFKKQAKKKLLFILDRAYVDMAFFMQNMGKDAHFICRTKTSFKLKKIGEFGFDTSLPVNTGVTSVFLAGMGTTSTAYRFIDYVDPETNQAYQFYTSLTDIEPGLIPHLYFKRWTIEKTFDVSKNVFMEQKAWATGYNALEIQAQAICFTFNILRLIEEVTIASMDDFQKKKLNQKYKNWINLREQKAKKAGQNINPLLKKLNRISRMALQFFRTIKNLFCRKIPLRSLKHILADRMIRLI